MVVLRILAFSLGFLLEGTSGWYRDGPPRCPFTGGHADPLLLGVLSVERLQLSPRPPPPFWEFPGSTIMPLPGLLTRGDDACGGYRGLTILPSSGQFWSALAKTGIGPALQLDLSLSAQPFSLLFPSIRPGPQGTLAQGIQSLLPRGPNLQQGSSMGKRNYIWKPFLLKKRSKLLTFL